MSRVEWIDPDTGEVLDGEREGAIPFEGPSDAELADAQGLGDYFTRKVVQLEAQEAAAKAQHERAKKRIAAERRALERFEPEVEIATRTLLKGNSKSVDFAYGRAAFRKTKRVVIEDEDAALAWAMEHDPGAVKWADPKLLKSKLAEDCPQRTVVEDESFSVRGAK